MAVYFTAMHVYASHGNEMSSMRGWHWVPEYRENYVIMQSQQQPTKLNNFSSVSLAPGNLYIVYMP
jgi:hypothetical protein